MPFTVITNPAVGDPTRKDTFSDPVIADLNFLNGALQSALAVGINNGSFENGSGANVAPANWTASISGGMGCNIENTAAAVDHGAQAFSMTLPGAGRGGGVSLTTNDFYPIGELQTLVFSWFMKASSATLNAVVYVVFYDVNQALVSTSTLYNNSTTNPTSWTGLSFPVQAPTTARFFKLQIVGADNSVAGLLYWDGVTYSVGVAAIGPIAFNASTSWTSPFTGWVNVDAIGAGGGGGGATGSNGGGGGGAGSFSKYKFFVVNGNTYTVTVGAPGSGGSAGNYGGTGGVSWFGSSANVANGGLGGSPSSTGGGGGPAGAALSWTNGSGLFGLTGAAGTGGGAGSYGLGGFAALPWSGDVNNYYGRGGQGGLSSSGFAGNSGLVIIS